MSRVISLAHLTVFELTPPQLVMTASDAGFRHIGIRLSPAAPGEQQHPMIGDTPMLRETRARLDNTGVSVFDVEILRLKADTNVTNFEPVLETAAKLGAKHVLVAGDAADERLMIDLFGSVCDLGQRFSLTMNMEFMPWTGVKTLDQAMRITRAAARPNGRVLIDTIHLDRTGGTADQVASIPPEFLAYAQICDATGPRPGDYETMIYQARNERAFPGEGNLDLLGVLRALPEDLPLSLEVPTKKLAETVTPLERARRARTAIEVLLERSDLSERAET
jgi:sugar phosphate isomerase/epimerase